MEPSSFTLLFREGDKIVLDLISDDDCEVYSKITTSYSGTATTRLIVTVIKTEPTADDLRKANIMQLLKKSELSDNKNLSQ